MALTSRVVTSFEELASIRADWAALLARSATNSPTLSPTWLLPWWQVFGRTGRALCAVLFFHGRRLVGLAPLLSRRVIDRAGLPLRRIELLGSGEDEAEEICSDYIGVLAERGVEHAIAEAFAAQLVTRALGPWDELLLCAMSGDSASPTLLVGALRDRGLVVGADLTGISYYIRLPSDWEAYLAALSSSKRHLIRCALRDLERWAGGTLRVERAETHADLARGVAVLEALHAERWKDEGGGVFAAPRFKAFHASVMPSLLDANALDLRWLTVHGRPIAAAYNVIWDKKVYFYQSGRSLDVPHGIRPGVAMHAIAIRDAIAAGHREYDFLTGNARYKSELALDARPLVRLRALRPSLLDVARQATEVAVEHVRALRARVRRTPANQRLDAE